MSRPFPKAEAILTKDLKAADQYVANLKTLLVAQENKLSEAVKEADGLRAELAALEAMI